ncbi:hypothetical protein [Sphingosinicella humi]|uniref:hypothetical protein n=1 Tax=Allosphingosinicella humi TaxID=2068657 RepID=UPI001304B95F|nr:hypothetical protein [Sphingosinicella humi]
MITAENQQGRARGLYDEQLQRQKQEKLLFRHPRAREAATPAMAPAGGLPRA